MRSRTAAAMAVALALPTAPAVAQTQGGFTAKPPHGSFADLVAGRLKVPVHCPSACTVAARLTVPAQDARRMAMPFWETQQLLAVENDTDTFEAGDWMLGLELVTPAVRKRLTPSLLFGLFSTVRVKVELQADLDDGESLTPSVTGRLRWPTPASEQGGRGTNGIVRSISGPSSFALGTPSGAFSVRLRPTTSDRVIRAGVTTAGAILSTPSFAFYDGARKAGPAALHRGGTFTLHVPLRHGNLATAADLAPLAAQVFVDVADRATGHLRDHAIHRFALTR
jgi:hypothetical protein